MSTTTKCPVAWERILYIHDWKREWIGMIRLKIDWTGDKVRSNPNEIGISQNSQHRIGNQHATSTTSQPPNLGLGISPQRHRGTRGHKLHESPAPQPNQTDSNYTRLTPGPKVAITSHFPLRFQIKDWDFATVFRSSWNNFSDAPADDLCLVFLFGVAMFAWGS